MPASDHGFPVADLSDDQLAQLRRDVLSEKAKRKEIGTSPEKIEEAIDAYQRESGKGQGEPWEQPIKATDSYRLDALVTLDGELWRNWIPRNPHKPGVAGWRLEPTLDEDGNEIPPRFVRPSSAADAYGPGDRITWTDGKVYEAQRVGVDWDPGNAPQDWDLVEAETEPPENGEPDDPEEPSDGDGDEDEGEDEGDDSEPSLPEWKAGVDYQPGDRFTYQGHEYRVVQAHKSAAHWPPDQVASLYERQG